MIRQFAIASNFDRVLMICFDQPLKSSYYHKVTFLTKRVPMVESVFRDL